MNLGNALEAAAGGDGAKRGAATDARSELYARARAEADACFAAAGIDAASEEEDRARRGDLVRIRPVDGQRRGGGSSWQSLARGTGAIEADHLNGEIVLLGRQHGVPTPVNELLQRTANRLARNRTEPGSVPAEHLLRELDVPCTGEPASVGGRNERQPGAAGSTRRAVPGAGGRSPAS